MVQILDSTVILDIQTNSEKNEKICEGNADSCFCTTERHSPSSGGLLLRLVGLGGGTGGCLAWGGTGGGILESAVETAGMGRGMGREGKSSVIRETVLGGLEIGTSLEEEDDEEEEEDDEGGFAYLLESGGRLGRGLGGSKACLGGGGSCLESGGG